MNLLLNIDVPDVSRAITFYRDALGWRHMRSLFDGGVAEMLGAGCRIYLIERASSESATATGVGARTYDRHWTPSIRTSSSMTSRWLRLERCRPARYSGVRPMLVINRLSWYCKLAADTTGMM